MTITKSQAASELLKRRKCRESFVEFCKYVYDEFETPWHIIQLCDKLESVERGEIKRLIINEPPRHGKSLTASVLFPAWYLGHHPSNLIVQAGHGDSIAKKHSMDCRRIVTDNKYDKLFPDLCEKLTSKMRSLTSIKEWTTSKSGGYFACGVGGSLVGRGANIILIDDPFKSRLDANSVLQRERVIDWYKSTCYTRLEPEGAIIIINARWHIDDLVGTLLKEGAEDWDVLSLPAIKEGEYDSLWPERFNAEKLSTIREAIGLREWTSQYLQSPTVDSGNRFKCDQIDIVDEKEFPNCVYSRSWDLASTEKQRGKGDPDYTVGILGTLTTDEKGLKHMWIKNVVRGQWEAPKRDSVIKQRAEKDGPRVGVYIEAFGPYVDTFNHMRGVLAGRNIIRKSHLPGDKTLKASGYEAIMEAGNFHIAKAPWNDAFISEFKSFPEGAHDDIVDACSIIYGESTKAKSGILMIR